MKIFITPAVLRQSVLASGRAHLRCLAPGQHCSEKTTRRWLAVAKLCPICAARELNPDLLYQIDSDVIATGLSSR